MTSPSSLSAPHPVSGPGLPKQRVIQFFLVMFLSSGAMAAYGGIWLKQQGFSESEIGIINAVPIGLLIVLNLWIGRIADRAKDWKDAIQLLAILATIGPIGLFFGGGFWPVLLCMTLILVTHGLILPVADAAAMRLGRREGFDFAHIRAYGTLGYITGILLTGTLAALFGPVVFLPIVLGGVIIRAYASHRLPLMRGARKTDEPGARHLAEVMKPWFLLPLVGWALVYGALAVLGPFQALLWTQEGISPYWIMVLIALAPIAETVLFVTFKRISTKIRARHLILISALAMVVRLIGFGLEPGVGWLIPLQMLHAITYSMGFLGCVAFIANWTSEDIAAEAQSFFVVIQQVATAAMLLMFGWLSQAFGAQAYFALALLCILGAVLITLSLRLQEPLRR